MAIPGNLLGTTTESVDPNTSGWRSRTNCSISLGAGGRNGDGALMLTSSASGEMQAETVSTYPVIETVTYFVFADAGAGTSSVPERIGVEWLDDAGAAVGAITWSLLTDTADAAWHRISVAGACPVGATRARVVLSATPTGAGLTHFFENVYLGLPYRTTGNLFSFNTESGGELGTAEWFAEVNSTVSRGVPPVQWPSGWYYSGGHVIYMTADADGDASMRSTERPVATPGEEYETYCYLNPPDVSATCWVELRFYTDGVQIDSVRAVLDPPGTGWWRQRVSGVAPSGANQCSIAAGIDSATTGQQLGVEGIVAQIPPDLRSGTVVPLEDASFEQGVGAWTVGSGPATIARSSPWDATAAHGTYALDVDSATAATSVLHSGAYPVTAEESWRVEYNARWVSGTWDLDVAVRWFDDGDTEISVTGFTGAATLPSDGEWWILADDLTAPVGAVTARIEIEATAGAASSTVQIDKVTLRQVLPQTVVEADADLARAVLTLRELPEDDRITVHRVEQDGTRTLVRGLDGLIDRQDITSDLMILEDYEAPLGVPVSYYVETHDSAGALTGTRTSAAVTIDPGDSNWCWLKDPGNPQRNLRAMVASPPEWSRPIDQAVYRVRGRRNAVVHSDVRGGLEGDLTVYTASDAEAEALHWLLDPGHTLLWQVGPSVHEQSANLYVNVAEAGLPRVTPKAFEAGRLWALSLTQADMPTSVAVSGTAGRSWRDVLAEHATWGEVRDRYASWEDVLLGRQIGDS